MRELVAMRDREQRSPASIWVQTTVVNPAEMALNSKTPHRISLSAVLDLRATRPRIAPELASALGVELEHLDWISQFPSASIWIEIFGRSCFYWAIVDPLVEGLMLHRLILDHLDLVIDGNPPAVRVRHAEYNVEI